MQQEVLISVRKFLKNPLLERKQFVVDIYHPGLDISKKKVRSLVAKKMRVQENTIMLYKFKTKYGGGRTQGVCLIYDSQESMKKYEPYHRMLTWSYVEQRKKEIRKTKKVNKKKKRKQRGTNRRAEKKKERKLKREEEKEG